MPEQLARRRVPQLDGPTVFVHVPADDDDLAIHSGAALIHALTTPGWEVECLVSHRKCDVELPGKNGEQWPRTVIGHVAQDQSHPNAAIAERRGIMEHRVGDDALARVNARSEEQPGETYLAGLPSR